MVIIAVMFTFSFSSAFAATPATPGAGSQATLDSAYDAAKTNLLAVKNAVVQKLADEYTERIASGTDSFDLAIAKSVYTQVAEAVYADYMNVLAIKYKEVSGFADASKTNVELAKAISGAEYGSLSGKAYGDVDEEAEFGDLVISYNEDAYLDKTLHLALNDYRETVKTELGKIDTSLYTTDVMDKDDPYAVTYRQLAEKIKAERIADAADVTVSEDATGTDLKPALVKLNKMVSSSNIVGVVTYSNLSGGVVNVTYKFADGITGYNNTPLVTKDALKDTGKTLDAKKADAKAQAASEAATYYKNNLTDAGKKAADAYTEVLNCRIDNSTSAEIDTLLGSFPAVDAIENTFTFEQIKAKYDALATEAKTLKVLVDATGKLVYDSTKIDANLAKAMIEVYDGDTVYKYDLKTDALNEAEDLDWAKKVKIAALEASKTDLLYNADGTSKYYDVEKAKVEAKYQEVIDKINAATTVDQVNTFGPASVSIIGIKDKDGVVGDIQKLSKFNTEYTKLENYVKYMNGDIKSWEDGYKTMMSAKDLAKFYAEKGARTNDEIVALVNDAKAECDKLPTAKEASDAKKAVEALVKALPAYVTLADKEVVTAAWTAADDLGVAIDNQNKLTNAVTQVKTAEKKAMDDALEALPALDKVTAANKDAVKALADAVKAYETNPMYKEGAKFAAYADAAAVKNYVKAVRDAVKADVVNAVAGLPANPTKAQVEAVRAAYDAFVADYTDAEEPYKAADAIVNIDKLLYAEATIAANEITSVETLKITASTTAKKGSITVKWTVVGDTAAVEGYEIWKSTKKNSGFKKAFTATKLTYKNTKGLKAGTKYYYKVRAIAFDADGAKVKSDWSNKGIRTAK